MEQGTKVFVGSLPPGTKPEELRHLFENYGIVVECDVMNRCGFVHMETTDMAQNAIAALHSTDFKGQMIVVEPGRPKDRKKGPGGIRGGGSNMGRGAGDRNMGDRRGGGGGPRGGGGPPGRGGRGGSNFNDRGNNGFGPMRYDNFKPQRNAPYSRGGVGGFGGRGRHFDNGGGSNNQYDNWGESSSFPENNSNYSSGVGGSFSGNMSNSGSFGGGFGGSSRGNAGQQQQDRRGFALPQQQHGDGRGANQGFGGGMSNQNNGGMFQRRNNMGGRGGMQNSPGGNFGRGGGMHKAQAVQSYNNEFPPLGGRGRGMNRNAPRQNMMPNRRY